MISTIAMPGTPIVYTANRECDARTAITRGLAEYLSGMTIDSVGGRRNALRKVFQTWPDAEDEAVYPSAVVLMRGVAAYDSSRFVPGINDREKLPAPDGRYVSTVAEMVGDLTVELWCNDSSERADLVAAFEEELVPYDDMYGLMLDLPHYYGNRAVYELKDVQYIDDEQTAMQRYRKALFTLTAQMPVVRLRSYPMAKPRVVIEVNPIVEVSVT